MNDRDTKFRKFAELLQDELIAAYDADYGYEGIVTIIAQRAYDLARHVIAHVDCACTDTYYLVSDEQQIANIPDLTQWPETPTPRLLDRSTWPPTE